MDGINLSNDTEKDISDFLGLKNLDQISIRLYYLYYRLLETLREEKMSFFRYTYDTITAVIGGFLGIVSLYVFIKDLDDIYKASAVGVTIAVIIGLIFLKEMKKPKSKPEYENLSDNLELAINLDQIFKQANQCILLMSMSKKNPGDSDIKDFLSDSYDILKDSITYVEKLTKKMKEEKTLEEALKMIHINQKFLERRIKFGNSVLSKCESVSNK